MQHQVPQFIEVEDKIFGPLTAKQFFYILGGGAVIFIMYVFLQLWLVILLGIPVAAFSISLAFLKVNGQPSINILNSALGFATTNRLYLWRKVAAPSGKKPGFLESSKPGFKGLGAAPKLTQSKLQDLAWSLDIQQKIRR